MLDTDTNQENIEKVENSSTIVKIQELQDISVYWNSFSEMYIPTSVWDQSRKLKYGIFEVMDATLILEMMKDMFTNKVGMQNQYIMDPITYRMQFSFRNTYKHSQDSYKYKLAIMINKIQINMNPQRLRDMLRFRQYLEAQTYIRELQKYRPHIRIQTFIDYRKSKNGKLSVEIEKKRKAVVRDWFRYVLWYVRLRKAARSFSSAPQTMYNHEGKVKISGKNTFIPVKLLKIQRKIQLTKGKPLRELKGIDLIKKASLAQYAELKQEARKKAIEHDSDDDALGYETSSSDDAESLMFSMEKMHEDILRDQEANSPMYTQMDDE